MEDVPEAQFSLGSSLAGSGSRGERRSRYASPGPTARTQWNESQETQVEEWQEWATEGLDRVRRDVFQEKPNEAHGHFEAEVPRDQDTDLISRWWTTMKNEHDILVLVYPGRDVEHQSFSILERWLFLCLTVACAWIGVYVKLAYFVKWVHVEEYIDFHSDRLAHLVDAGFIAMYATVLDVLLGKAVVKKVLKTDWEYKGGYKGALSTLSCAWAALISAAALVHATLVLVTLSEVSEKVGMKWMSTVAMKFLVVEPSILGLLLLVKSAKAKAKDE